MSAMVKLPEEVEHLINSLSSSSSAVVVVVIVVVRKDASKYYLLSMETLTEKPSCELKNLFDKA